MVKIMHSSALAIEIGIEPEDRKAIAEGLARLLADSYTLYLKTHNFHWNVTGPMFGTLHLMFEQQYSELALALDLIAERIRALSSSKGSRPSRERLDVFRDAEDAGDQATMDLSTQRLHLHEKNAWMLRSLLE